MSKIKLTKMSGAGNSFVVIDLTDKQQLNTFNESLASVTRPQLAVHLCASDNGLHGADGLVILEPNDEFDFQWDFYNNDGSAAEMCGNAARCIGLFGFKRLGFNSMISFNTLAGPVYAQYIEDESIDVQMTKIHSAKYNQVLNHLGEDIEYDYIDSGVPHCVIEVRQLDLEQLRKQALVLRQPQFFKPRGANITYWQKTSNTSIRSASFERGVEEFTQACGTGAVAAALSFQNKYKAKNKTHVSVPGGELCVTTNEDRPHLIGPAKFIGEIEVESDQIVRGIL